MHAFSAANRLLVLAALSLICAAAANAQVLNSGAWHVVTKENAPEYTGKGCTWEGWTGAERKGGKSIIRWLPADHDKERGKPVKFILMFGDPDDVGAWYKREGSVLDWFSCNGQGQWEFIIETSADVGELVDLNPAGHYRMWVAVEYEDKSRLPFDGRGFITISEYNDETRKTLSPCAVRLPEDYNWTDKNSSHAGNTPDAHGKVDRDGFNVVMKAGAKPFGGVLVPNYAWASARKPTGPAVIKFPAALDDKVGGKAVKFLLFFGEDKAECGVDHVSELAWYECRGEGQWGWFLEAGSSVRQVYDPNAGKYRVWIAVEYQNGKRLPFYSETFPVVETSVDVAKLDANCVKLPKDYKWDAPVEVKDPMMDAAMQPYIDGAMMAFYWVDLHADPKPGQLWETRSKMAGIEYTQKRQVVALREGKVIVEETSTMMGMGFILAYEVDPAKKAEDKVNVLRAWIGKPGGKPIAIKVMKHEDGSAVVNNDWKVSTTSEPFKELELAGKKWSGTKTSVTAKHKNGKDWSETATWQADGGYFNRIVKTTLKGSSAGYDYEMTTELVSQSTSGKAWLTWE